MKKAFNLIKMIIYPVLIASILVMFALSYNITTTIPIILGQTVLIMASIWVTMYLHERFHRIAYKIINKNADIVISMKGCVKSVWNKSNEWYNKQQIMFVLLFPLCLSFILILWGRLTSLAGTSFMILGYSLALLNIAGMILDFCHTISILFDKQHKKFKYDKNAKLLRG